MGGGYQHPSPDSEGSLLTYSVRSADCFELAYIHNLRSDRIHGRDISISRRHSPSPARGRSRHQVSPIVHKVQGLCEPHRIFKGQHSWLHRSCQAGSFAQFFLSVILAMNERLDIGGNQSLIPTCLDPRNFAQ
jgi:hypothetical protein